MKRISRNNTVPVDKRHHVREPVAEVSIGESFIVETINFRTPIIQTPEDANPKEYKEREETGPIYIKGIDKGDILAIHIENIFPEGHASGGSANNSDKGSFLEIKDSNVYFPGGLTAPLKMMIGDIRVQPEKDGPNPWDYGGNMDFKDICAGNILMLKVQLPGGLLVLGDLHAAQGDGEIGGLGAECAGEVTLRIEKEKKWPVERPTIKKPASFVSIACRPDYAEARDIAVADASKILSHLKKCTLKEAELYVKTVGDLRNGAVWTMGLEDEAEWVKSLPLVIGVEVPLD